MSFQRNLETSGRRGAPLATITAGLAALILAATGCAATSQSATATREEPAPAEAPEASGKAAETAEETAADEPRGLFQSREATGRSWELDYPEPPDGHWLIDEHGRQYFIMLVEKLEGQYRWMDEDTVRVRGGMMFDVTGHDEENFWMKVYRVEPVALPPKGPSAEDIARLEAAYEIELPTADRLRFTSFSAGLPERGQWRNGFALADMNGDGHLDLVHGPPRKGHGLPVIFLGDGSGNWREWEAVRFPNIPFDYGDVAVADFNGDGHPDLALAIHLRGGIVLVGDGEGGFEAWSRGIPLDDFDPGQGQFPTFSSRQVEALDWNRDGRPDLVFLSEGPVNVDLAQQRDRDYGKVIFLNQGDGSWERAESPQSLGGASFGDTLLLADFDGDGLTDFAHSSGVVGDRGLVNLAPAEAGRPWRTVFIDSIRPRSNVWAVGAGDFDGDGRDDLLVSYTSRELNPPRSGLDLMLSRPAPQAEAATDASDDASPIAWERQPLWAGSGDRRLHAVSGGDIDGDGRLEVVALDGDGAMMILRRDGDGVWMREQNPPPAETEARCRGVALRLVDLDGQPGAEIVAGFAGEPGSEVLFNPVGGAGCRHNGSLRAWTVKPAGTGEGAAASLAPSR